ncbi:hypothetical protein GCM10025734_38800 [Kitasatospora paranensis]
MRPGRSSGPGTARGGRPRASPAGGHAGTDKSGRAAMKEEAGHGAESAPPSLYGPRLWLEVQHLLLNLPIGIAGFVLTVVSLSVGLGLAVTVVGLPLLALGLAAGRRAGALGRRRARHALGSDIAEPEPLTPVRPGVAGWVIAGLTDGLSWRSALYTVLLLPWGCSGSPSRSSCWWSAGRCCRGRCAGSRPSTGCSSAPCSAPPR